MVREFEILVKKKIDAIFPIKEVKIYSQDKEFMTAQMRKIRRQKSLEYRKNKKSEKFIRLQKKFLELKGDHSKKFIKEIEELKDSN